MEILPDFQVRQYSACQTLYRSLVWGTRQLSDPVYMGIYGESLLEATGSECPTLKTGFVSHPSL